MNTCPQCGGTLYCDPERFADHIVWCREKARTQAEERKQYPSATNEQPNTGTKPRDYDWRPLAYAASKVEHMQRSLIDTITERVRAELKAELKAEREEREATERKSWIEQRRAEKKDYAERNKPTLPEGYEFLEPGTVINRDDIVFATRTRYGSAQWWQTRCHGKRIFPTEWFKYARRKVWSAQGGGVTCVTKFVALDTLSLADWRKQNAEVEAWAEKTEKLEGVGVPMWVTVRGS